MKKLTTALALALCCVSLSGFAQEAENEIVKEAEVSIEAEPCSGGDDTSSQNTDESVPDAEQDKGGN